MSEVNVTFCNTCVVRETVIDGKVCPKRMLENMHYVFSLFAQNPDPVRDELVGLVADTVRRPESAATNILSYQEETGTFEAVPADEIMDDFSLATTPSIIECIEYVQEHGKRPPSAATS